MLERFIEKRFLKQYKKIYDKINTFNKNNKGRYKDKEELKNHNYYCEELEINFILIVNGNLRYCFQLRSFVHTSWFMKQFMEYPHDFS